MDFSHHIMHTIQHIIKCEQDIMTMMHQMFLFLTIRQLWRSIFTTLYSKTEVYMVYSIYNFLIFDQNIDCGYSLQPPRQGGSDMYPVPIVHVLKKIRKLSKCFIWKFSILLRRKNHCVMHEPVFVMTSFLPGQSLAFLLTTKRCSSVLVMLLHVPKKLQRRTHSSPLLLM